MLSKFEQVNKPIRRRPLERPRRRWEDNIRTDLKEIGINTREWVDSAQDRASECGIELPNSVCLGVN